MYLCVKDLSRNGPLGDWPILRISRYDEVTAKTTLSLHNLRAQEFSQSTSGTESHPL